MLIAKVTQTLQAITKYIPKFERKPLYHQIDEYIEWKSQFSFSASEEQKYLYHFAEKCNKEKVQYMSLNDIEEYRRYLLDSNTCRTPFGLESHIKALRCFFRYFKMRKYITFSPSLITADGVLIKEQESEENIKKRGRPLDIETIKLVKKLRNRHRLSFRAIATVLEKDVSMVHKWYKYQI